MLRDNGYTEARYIREQRAGRAAPADRRGRRPARLKTPGVLLAAINTFTNETRKADYFVLPRARPLQGRRPRRRRVQSYYDMRKDSYRTPEFRKATFSSSRRPKSRKRCRSPTRRRRRSMTRRHAAFRRPGKAHHRAIDLSAGGGGKRPRAHRCGRELRRGRRRQEAGGVMADIGVTTKAAMFDKAVAEAAFALPQAGVTAPVPGKFGWVLARVSKIEPGADEKFRRGQGPDQGRDRAESRPRARPKSCTTRSRTCARPARPWPRRPGPRPANPERVTDAAGAGEGAAGQPGAPIAALAAMPELVKAIFASDVGVDNESVVAQGRRLFVVRNRRHRAVARIAARRGQAAVIRALQESDSPQRDLAAKANELARRIDAGESLAVSPPPMASRSSRPRVSSARAAPD